MSYYYMDRPPERPSRWRKYIPGWVRQFWTDVQEIVMVTQVVFSILLPVMGVLVGFVLLFAALLFLLSLCSKA